MCDNLDNIRIELEKCKRCPLWKTRTKVVPGEGASGGLMLVGEAPGKDEDLQGRPFVGRAGKLLESSLEAAGITRESVYITNVVKCRPPGNRKPRSNEVMACKPYLFRELNIVKPSAILLMGNTAAFALIGKRSVSSSRGRVEIAQGYPAIVTFHPAAMLRNPALRPLFMQDLLEALQMTNTKDNPI
ncbi:MAG: uracil-DNA glycosylase [Thermoprotei archaeon]|jgi:DNA polymerase